MTHLETNRAVSAPHVEGRTSWWLLLAAWLIALGASLGALFIGGRCICIMPSDLCRSR